MYYLFIINFPILYARDSSAWFDFCVFTFFAMFGGYCCLSFILIFCFYKVNTKTKTTKKKKLFFFLNFLFALIYNKFWILNKNKTFWNQQFFFLHLFTLLLFTFFRLDCHLIRNNNSNKKRRQIENMVSK